MPSVSPTQSPELVPSQQGSGSEPTSRVTQIYEELHGSLVSQLSQWLRHEKEKRSNGGSGGMVFPGKLLTDSPVALPARDTESNAMHHEDGGHASDTDTALEKLERILRESDRKAHHLLGRSHAEKHRFFPHRKSSTRSRRRKGSYTGGSSDTEYAEGDALVPSTDAVLDNSKTLGFTGGTAYSELDLSRTISRSVKEGSWLKFKNEIIRLTHTLRIRGWRQVPLNSGSTIEVERLSGALTNAVYVVTPPKNLAQAQKSGTDTSTHESEKPPRKRLPKYVVWLYVVK